MHHTGNVGRVSSAKQTTEKSTTYEMHENKLQWMRQGRYLGAVSHRLVQHVQVASQGLQWIAPGRWQIGDLEAAAQLSTPT